MKLAKKGFLLLTAMLYFAGSTTLAQTENDINPEDMAKAMQEMQNAFKQMNNASSAAEVIGFRELKAFLPKAIMGMDLHNSKGEKTAAMGMKLSQASGEYGTRGSGPYVQIEIVDTGSLQGIMGMSMAGWAMMEIDRESDTEMEQTFTHKGYKGIKKYFFEKEKGEVSLSLGARVIITFKIQNIPLDKFTGILDHVDYAGIEALIAKTSK